MSRKPFLHEQSDFRDLLRVVAERDGILPQLVEKDYWLMHVLWAVQDQGMTYHLKGGTSLSKGWHMIERFSEDIDILIFPPENMDIPMGKNQSKTKHREKREEYFGWLKETISVPGSVQIQRDHEFDDHDSRNAGLRIDYRSEFESLSFLKEGVLLEVGFDVTTPNDPLSISSWAYDFAESREALDIFDNRASQVPCYYPEYTLVEKLSAISKKYRQETSGKEVLNFTRHYYDVFQLLGEARVNEFLGTKAYYTHKAARFQKDDEHDIAKNPAFTLDDPVIRKRYKDRYENSAGLYLRGQPPFDNILNRIQENAERL